MGVFGIYDAKFAFFELHVKRGFVVAECAVAVGAIFFGIVFDVFDGSPADLFVAVEQDVHVDVFAVHFEGLLCGVGAVDVKVHDEKVVAFHVNTAKGKGVEVGFAYKIEELFVERM
jgi:hypothetical protein